MNFHKFYENELKMKIYFDNFRDNRIKPEIPASHIAESIIYMPALESQSLLQVDQWARLPVFRNLIGTDRPMVASDTTLQRVLPNLELKPIYATVKALYNQIVSTGLSKYQLSSGDKLKIAAVDGSGFGHHFASVVALVGKDVFPLDAHVFEQHGKELPSSRAVLSRLTNNLGKSWCDIFVYDGLCLNKKDFKLAKEKYGCDLVVKSSEESSQLLQDAKACLIVNNPDIEIATGVDTKRNLKYEVRAIKEFRWKGLEYPLKIAWVKEEKINPNPKENPIEEFYVVTTRQDLTPTELREIAHSRWEIENNVFKQLNSLIKSKYVHTHDTSTFIRLLLLWLIGFSLLKIFLLDFEKLNWNIYAGKVRITWKFLLQHLQWSLFLPLPQELFT
jgi:hypothetical protein